MIEKKTTRQIADFWAGREEIFYKDPNKDALAYIESIALKEWVSVESMKNFLLKHKVHAEKRIKEGNADSEAFKGSLLLCNSLLKKLEGEE